MRAVRAISGVRASSRQLAHAEPNLGAATPRLLEHVRSAPRDVVEEARLGHARRTMVEHRLTNGK